MEFIKIALLLLVTSFTTSLKSQRFPGTDQNIEHLVVFGREASGSWGDNDKTQIIFVMVPEWIDQPVYLRIFDPDTGGNFDESNQGFNTKMKYTLFGGKDAHPVNIDTDWEQNRSSHSGVRIDSLVVGLAPDLDNQWYTFKPLDPATGQSYYGFRIFKILIEGMEGDDGNLFNFFLSSSPHENIGVNLANFFSYELSLCLPQYGRVKLYPFIEDFSEDIYVSVFDLDHDGEINFRPPNGPTLKVSSSGDGEWQTSSFGISPNDYNQFSVVTIFCDSKVGPNNTTIHVTGGSGTVDKSRPYPFFASPTAIFRPEGLTPKFSRK